MNSRERAIALITRIAASDYDGASALLAPDAKIEITGQWPYGREACTLEQLRAFAASGDSGLAPLVLTGAIRRAIANRGRVAVEVAGVSDYAVMVLVSKRKVVSARFYFDTLHYTMRDGAIRSAKT